MENSLKKYEQSAVTGEAWVRSKRIVIENPLNKENLIKFIEEKVILVDGEYVHVDQGILDLIVDASNVNDSFDIIDPETGEPSGSKMTYATLYNVIFSVYMDLAMKRDAANAEPATTDPDPTV